MEKYRIFIIIILLSRFSADLQDNSGTHWNSTFCISIENFDLYFPSNQLKSDLYLYIAPNQTLPQGTEQVQHWKKLKLSKYNHSEITCRYKKMLKSQKMWALTDMISIFNIKISSWVRRAVNGSDGGFPVYDLASEQPIVYCLISE